MYPHSNAYLVWSPVVVIVVTILLGVLGTIFYSLNKKTKSKWKVLALGPFFTTAVTLAMVYIIVNVNNYIYPGEETGSLAGGLIFMIFIMSLFVYYPVLGLFFILRRKKA